LIFEEIKISESDIDFSLAINIIAVRFNEYTIFAKSHMNHRRTCFLYSLQTNIICKNQISKNHWNY